MDEDKVNQQQLCKNHMAVIDNTYAKATVCDACIEAEAIKECTEDQEESQPTQGRGQSGRTLVIAPSGHYVCGCYGKQKFLMHVYSDGKNYYCPFCNRSL